ncbi:hypothetical protein N7462_008859 [Penicillium macrosclerotiorum]|uniref:uncharacterized protein n=1 Tax=Penicillium macrosclerotiorum TaxID=303699 RepID=UPI002546CE57|nr:uncharacterized protein N7462_008859 [Penicillium macrosclerotiorum]KAJ5675962.1 hypothetical protein N7462_008859 [Penicillium macrosclerotiorum]
MEDEPSLVLFGPQTRLPPPEYLFNIRSAIIARDSLKRFIEAIQTLDNLWEELVSHDPCLNAVAGHECAKSFRQWILHGKLFDTAEGSKFTYAEREDDLIGNAIVAMRQAFCIGAYVDLDEVKNHDKDGIFTTLAVRWKSEEGSTAVPAVPIRSNSTGGIMEKEQVRSMIFKDILTKTVNWQDTIISLMSDTDMSPNIQALVIGLGDSLSRALAKKHKIKCVKVEQYLASKKPTALFESPMKKRIPSDKPQDISDGVAIIGMACKFPGAESPAEFWDILTSGTSMLDKMPLERFDRTNIRRSPSLDYWGNFVSDVDAFDHQFFGKSSREAKSMDPQQRLLLQVAYQALEDAGYFGVATDSQDLQDVGCYIGVCSSDYNDNVASHTATAFSTLGTLRAFLSGRISHFFGLQGPSLTLDTACSSSAVAIHSACNAIKMGECTAALAGGVSIYTSPYFYQNLSAASLLSKTGATKPFDTSADGYCRGEGIGIVVLKKLSAAIMDGDCILGTVLGSGINQNANCTAITVPETFSQQSLYRRICKISGINPEDVSFVEAHGTGTPVGDPIEFESIRNVFGSTPRKAKLNIASLKGNIGHLEGASGVAALIKTILMMRHRKIPPQANFTKLSPRIRTLGPYLNIPECLHSWDPKVLIACINNYGASGSNAVMVVRNFFNDLTDWNNDKMLEITKSLNKYPIFISAKSKTSLHAFCKKLLTMRAQLENDLEHFMLQISFKLAFQQNYSFPYRLVSSISKPDDFFSLLSDISSDPSPQQAAEIFLSEKYNRPLVLVCGGQISDYVGISRDLYDSCPSFRYHLISCDRTLQSLGYPGLFPLIFEPTPVDDIVLLQSMIFSHQYSCPKSWIDSGVKIDCVVGHSLGHLAAMSISGVLTLEDGLKLVCGRARLMQTEWGPERGAMISIEADLNKVKSLIAAVTKMCGDEVEIACYNGPTSYVIVGAESNIQILQNILEQENLRFKRLSVTHGFHSIFTESLLPALTKLAETLQFCDQSIPLEMCTAIHSWERVDPMKIASHTRSPVFFDQAVKRIFERLGPCIWLEAGSDSSVVNIVRRQFNPADCAAQHFQSLRLRGSNSLDSLVDATTNLWRLGLKCRFWPFKNFKAQSFSMFDLPSYQFDRPRHWIPWKGDSKNQASESIIANQKPIFLSLITFDGQSEATFWVDPKSIEYRSYVEGHAVLGQPLCPASLYIEIVCLCLKLLMPKLKLGYTVTTVQDLNIHVPLGLKVDGKIIVNLHATNEFQWKFQVKTTASEQGLTQLHANGVSLLADGNNVTSEMRRYERILKYEDVLANQKNENSDMMQGSLIYRLFSSIVTYSDSYRGVRSVVSNVTEVVGNICLPQKQLDPGKEAFQITLRLDNFVQLAGIFWNLLCPKREDAVYVCTKIEKVLLASTFLEPDENQNSWLLYAPISQHEDNQGVYDIFAFDNASRRIVAVVLGATFTSVALKSLRKALVNVNHTTPGGEDKLNNDQDSTPDKQFISEDGVAKIPPFSGKKETIGSSMPVSQTTSKPLSSRSDVFIKVRELLSRVTDISTDGILLKSTFDELGIDSLMTTEVNNEICQQFAIQIPTVEYQSLRDVRAIVDYLAAKLDDKGEDSLSNSSSGLFFESLSEGNPALTPPSNSSDRSTAKTASIRGAQECFEEIKTEFDSFAKRTNFSNFWKLVYPRQHKLVIAYIIEAFSTLGWHLRHLKPGERLPQLQHSSRHEKLIAHLTQILKNESIIAMDKTELVRSDIPIDPQSSSSLFEILCKDFPQHVSEFRLLQVVGSKLGECLQEKVNPLMLLFGNPQNKLLLEEVYTNGPMYEAVSKILGEFLMRVFRRSIPDPQDHSVFQILEVGGGTGATTKHILDLLSSLNIPFHYTFSDLSASLVAAARKKFSSFHNNMEFVVLDIENEPGEKFDNHFHVVLSTNCVHATKRLSKSATNLRRMLRTDGFACLVEFTKNLSWFDLVFGVLDGWWLFEDGRRHVLADEWFWEKNMKNGGFKHVTWTGGNTEESRTLRVIVGFLQSPDDQTYIPARPNSPPGISKEIVVFKRIQRNVLFADVYYPTDGAEGKWKIGLMVHGGGHVMFTRRNVNLKHLRHLIQGGFVPVAVDYRFCPELNILDGPMTDVGDSYSWAISELPNIEFNCPGLQIDGGRVGIVGWSTGAHLAMTIGFTSVQRGLPAPTAILAFYPPTDYQDDWWRKPIYPDVSLSPPDVDYDLLEGVLEEPITSYFPESNLHAPAGAMVLSDPRWRFVLHMNWKCQTAPVLVNGLPTKRDVRQEDQKTYYSLPQPSSDRIEAISPFAQIINGTYRSPTYFVHGTADDLIPVEQSEKACQALLERNIASGLFKLEGADHLFDFFKDHLEGALEAVNAGYHWLFEHV